ncbi:MAG: hypothetical protein M3380_13885, partial [Chloroflexota bacterium]|nr:hypothetical protein [Chloroflexota bacterium]
MVRRLPAVQDGLLLYEQAGEARSLIVESGNWYAWLADATVFAFASEHGSFTARKERASNRRGTDWYAYRRQGGQLRKIYLGKTEELTLDRLKTAAATLAGPRPTIAQRAHDQRPTATTHPKLTTHNSQRITSSDALLTTKLAIPLPRPTLVPRPRLADQLDGSI